MEQFKLKIVVGIFLFLVLLFSIHYFVLEEEEVEPLPVVDTTSLKENTMDDSLLQYRVDIKGEVKKTGVYELSSKSRVIDVIKKAGGLTKNADTTYINLSKKIEDEMVIIIHSKSEVKKMKKEIVSTDCVAVTIENDACICEKVEGNSKISLNQSSKEELMSLPGIGESKADAIIAYRQSKGGFVTIEEIKQVDGISSTIFEKIKELIVL